MRGRGAAIKSPRRNVSRDGCVREDRGAPCNDTVHVLSITDRRGHRYSRCAEHAVAGQLFSGMLHCIVDTVVLFHADPLIL